jgi:hypothetical protein
MMTIPAGTTRTATDLALIGSRALLLHLPDADRPRARDYDYIGTYDAVQEMIGKTKHDFAYPISGSKWIMRSSQTATNRPHMFEFEIAWSGSLAKEFLDLARFGGTTLWDRFAVLPPLDLLYTLKMSHRYLKNSPFFRKTMDDIHLMRQAGAEIRPVYEDWYRRRMKETYAYGHPSLNQTKATFFAGDGIDYVYDHDSIHEAVKLGAQPAYTYYATPGEEVKSSKELFFACPRHVQINAVIEEASVLALERAQIPYPNADPRRSFETAMMKVCTSITSGWFRTFSWESYYEVMARYDGSYVERFQKALDEGRVKRYSPG